MPPSPVIIPVCTLFYVAALKSTDNKIFIWAGFDQVASRK